MSSSEREAIIARIAELEGERHYLAETINRLQFDLKSTTMMVNQYRDQLRAAEEGDDQP